LTGKGITARKSAPPSKTPREYRKPDFAGSGEKAIFHRLMNSQISEESRRQLMTQRFIISDKSGHAAYGQSTIQVDQRRQQHFGEVGVVS
jgi:hypothetical protein